MEKRKSFVFGLGLIVVCLVIVFVYAVDLSEEREEEYDYAFNQTNILSIFNSSDYSIENSQSQDEQIIEKSNDGNYYVSLNGSDVSGDGSISNPWRHIQYAINQVISGSTIVLLGNGVYNESLNINKSIILQGEENAVIKQPGLSSTEPIISSTADLTLFNLTIGGEWWQATKKGVVINGSNLIMKNVIIRNIQNQGVIATNSSVNISNITLSIVYSASDIGIKLVNSTGVIEYITGGVRFDHIIDLYGNSSVIIRYNVLNGSNTANANGIRLNDYSTAVIEDNIIDGNETSGNLSRETPQAGILLNDYSFAQLKNNIIKEFAAGVLVSGEAKINASYNDIIDNVVDGVRTSALLTPNVDFGGGVYSSQGMNNIYGNVSIYHRNSADISMKYNYWGSANCNEIKNLIECDSQSCGEIMYEPFLDAPYPDGNLINCMQGDINNDCKVDILDLAKIGLCYDCSRGEGCWSDCEIADLSENGVIDILDLAEVGLNYGKEC